MPGIVGFCGKETIQDIKPECFNIVNGSVVHQSESDLLHLQIKSVAGDLGIADYTTDGISVYLYGDIYSIDSVDIDDQQACQQIYSHYLASTLRDFACKLNGYFTCLIVDQTNQKLVLLNDRYGLKPLYLWREQSQLKGFASEIKALACHTGFDPTVDNEALETYVDVGHYLGQQTMYEAIRRMAPATIIDVDMASGEYTEFMYWHWGNIVLNQQVSFEQAVDLSFELFDQAMRRVIGNVKGDTLAITLSGGLDSRVLLAGAKKYFKGQIATFTFGSAGCDDAVIAKDVADFAEVPNTFIEVNKDNWFAGRENGVWYTDGLKNILHMHALSSLAEIKAHSSYLMNGFLGDVTFGGSYLFPAAQSQSSLSEKAKSKYLHHADASGWSSPYFSGESSDPLFIYNRGVRFISAGSDLLGHNLLNLKPFFDNDLIDYLYSLPEDYRRDGRLYHHLLLKYYPEYFSTFPWQQTGKPITTQTTEQKSTAPSRKLRIKKQLIQVVKGSSLDPILRSIYRKLVKSSHYVAYDDWLRAPDFKDYVCKMLLSEHSEIIKFISKDKVERWVNGYFLGKPGFRPETIGSLLSIEVYFQKVKAQRISAD